MKSQMLKNKKADNKRNYFVSIGAGYNQLPLIRETKKLGLQIIGVDISPIAAGISECDIQICESIENYQEVYNKLCGLALDGEITGVLSKSYGSAVKTSSYIANKLNIPHIKFNRVDDFIDKKRMKTVLTDNDLKTPAYRVFNRKGNIQEKNFIYPFIIKPVMGHAKIGVSYIKSPEELNTYFKKTYSNNGEYIIEDYIEGDEIICVGIVYKKIFHLVDITDKIVTPQNFVDVMHISPSKYYDQWDNIKNIGQRIADIFEITTSPLIMELIITRDKEIYIIEAVPEFGGEFLSDVLVPVRTGYNIIRESINAVTDKGFKPPGKKKNKCAVTVKYIIGQNGKLSVCDPQGPLKREGVIFARMFKELGTRVRPPVNNHDRLGVVIAKAKTREESIALAEIAEKDMKIKIEN